MPGDLHGRASPSGAPVSFETASECGICIRLRTCAFGETAARLLAFALPLSLALSLLPARCCLKKLR